METPFFQFGATALSPHSSPDTCVAFVVFKNENAWFCLRSDVSACYLKCRSANPNIFSWNSCVCLVSTHSPANMFINGVTHMWVLPWDGFHSKRHSTHINPSCFSSPCIRMLRHHFRISGPNFRGEYEMVEVERESSSTFAHRTMPIR